MNKKKIILNLILVTSFLLISFVFATISINKNFDIEEMNNQRDKEKSIKDLKLSGYWDLSGTPIEIDGTATGVGAHNWTWAVSQPWCSGFGTWNHPYIIENVTINGYNASSCISIVNSDVFFEIRNCYVLNSSITGFNIYSGGIELEYVENGLIVENNCSFNNGMGISLKDCNNVTILDNYLYHNGYDVTEPSPGILLIYSDNVTVSGNFINSSYYRGINLQNSDSNIIYDNVINNTKYEDSIAVGTWCNYNNFSENKIDNTLLGNGIELGSSTTDNNLIKENFITNSNYYGIAIIGSHTNIIEGNDVSTHPFDGIYIYNSNNNNITGNRVYENRDGISIDDSYENIIKENNATNNSDDGIFLSGSDDNIIHSNYVVNNGGFGIWVTSCDNVLVKENTILNTTDMGLYIVNSNNNTAISNIIKYSHWGMEIANCDYAKIKENNVSHSTLYGIYLEMTDGASVSNNDIYFNGQYGIYLISEVVNTNIFENKIYNNSNSGIYILEANDTFVTSNEIYSNGQYGVRIFSNVINCNIDENKIYDNAFYGILITSNSHINSILNNEIYQNHQDGLRVSSSINQVIEANYLYKNQISGIHILDSNETILSENYVYENLGYGIRFTVQTRNCENNLITGNTIYNNSVYGMYVSSQLGSLFYNNVINENLILNHSQNGYTGIYLQTNCQNNSISANTIINNDYGIFLMQSDFNMIYENSLIKNGARAIYLYESDNNIFYENYIINTSGTGIHLRASGDSSDNNTIYNNFFINNTLHATDIPGTNFWNNSEIGNYWDTYTGSDLDDDGIGDTPYALSGGMDYLPIWDDSGPVISILSPINSTRLGLVMNQYSVIITDPYLDYMWYEFNGSTEKFFFASNGSFDSLTWQSKWNSINDGDYIYIRFYANDTWGFQTFQDLTVVKDTPPSISINAPLGTVEYGSTAPAFNVVVTDFQIDSMWYTLDSGLNNYTFTTNGTIDQDAWKALWDVLSDGDTITLTFYAEDNIGQITSASIQLTIDKLVTPPPGIPGYSIFLLIGLIIAVGIIIFLKKEKFKF